MSCTQDLCHLCRRLNAILQGEDPRGGADHRAYGRCCRAHIPGLDAQEHRVNNAHVLRAICRYGRGHVEITCGTFHKQAVCLDCREMRPPSDEDDFVASLCEPGSQVSAYTSRTKDGDAHYDLLRETRADHTFYGHVSDVDMMTSIP